MDDGYISLSVENNLPFAIDNFQLEFIDEDGSVWVNNQVQDINPGSSDTNQQNLVDSVVPRAINATPVITYSLAPSDCYLYVPLTDIEGETHNLYEILDEGKTVILDLFAVWCGPCWSFAETGVLEDLQAQYPDEVVCIAIEADPSTAESTIFGGGN